MRFFILYLIYGVVALALQSTWLANFPTESVRVDLLLIAVVYLSFSVRALNALPIIFLFGGMRDVISLAPFGLSIFSYVAIYMLMRLLMKHIAFQVGFGRFFWVAMLSAADKTICALLLYLWSGNHFLMTIWSQDLLAQACLDALLSLIAMPVLAWYGALQWSEITKPKGLVMKD